MIGSNYTIYSYTCIWNLSTHLISGWNKWKTFIVLNKHEKFNQHAMKLRLMLFVQNIILISYMELFNNNIHKCILVCTKCEYLRRKVFLIKIFIWEINYELNWYIRNSERKCLCISMYMCDVRRQRCAR